MALFVVLEDHTSNGITLLAGKVIDDSLYDTTALIAAGAALVAYVPVSMDPILAPFRASRRSKPVEPTGLTAMFAAAGLFNSPGGAVVSVFGRGGAVGAVAGDYAASEVTDDSGVGGADVAASLDLLDAVSTLAAVSAADTTPGFLGVKVVDGDGIVSELLNPGANEQLELTLGPHYLALASSGLYEGAVLSVGPSADRFSISAGEGLVIDSTTGPWPTIAVAPRPIAAKSDVVVTNILTQPVTYISIDSSDNVVQRGALPTPAQMRTEIFLGVVVHSDNVNVNVVNNLPSIALDVTAQVGDIMRGLGFFSLGGNVISANGANLSITKSAGTAFRGGVNFAVNEKDPHTATLPLQALVTFRYRDQLSAEGLDVTVLDPTSYDAAGTPTTVPSNNNATIQRVYIFPSGAIRIQPGQEVFANLGAAIDAVGKEGFLTEPNIEENGLLLASIAVRKNATDLSDGSQAGIFLASRFGDLGSVGSSATTSLQQAYNNSINPEIVTTVGGGAVQFRRGTALDADVVVAVESGAGAVNFSVAGDGTVTTASTVDGRDVAADGTKLDGIETAADVTDTANVAAALAVMDSDFAGAELGEMIRTGAAAYAVVKHNIVAVTDPLVTSDSASGYGVKSIWINVTLDTAWVCVDASVGAAVWLQLGAGGAALPDTTYVSSLSSSNFLTAPGSAGGVAAGGENDFIVLLWVRLEMGAGSSAQIAAAVGGWEARWNFGGLRIVAIDSAGTAFGPSNLGTNTAYGSSIANSEGRDALIIMRVIGGAGTPSLTVEINGAEVADATAANAGTPQTATAIMEIGGDGDTSNIEGMGYVSGTLTDAQLTVIREDSYAAGGLRDSAGVLTSMWNSETAVAAGEWADQIGTDDLTETGTVTSVTKRQKLAG